MESNVPPKGKVHGSCHDGNLKSWFELSVVALARDKEYIGAVGEEVHSFCAEVVGTLMGVH